MRAVASSASASASRRRSRCGAERTSAGSYGSSRVTPRPAHSRMRVEVALAPPSARLPVRARTRAGVGAGGGGARHPAGRAAEPPGRFSPKPCPRSYAARASGVPTSSHARCTWTNTAASPPVSGCVWRSRSRIGLAQRLLVGRRVDPEHLVGRRRQRTVEHADPSPLRRAQRRISG